MTEIKLTKRYPQSRTEDIVDAYMRGWNDALDAVQNGKFIINDDRKTEPTISKMEQVDEPQTDCTEALTLLWIKNMVTDEEFYRIDARLKCISCKWWNDTIVGGSECVSKDCTYQPKD